jgi:hypothetical protein
VGERIGVPFQGVGEGEAPLTWGQQHIWDWLRTCGVSLNMTAVRPLSGTEPVGDFIDELQYFMGRFQAMRTRLRLDGDRPRQVVAGAGEVPLEIVDLAPDEDPAARAEALVAEHRARDFDHAREWPVRMTLLRRSGAFTHLVVTLGHAVLDSAAAMVMFRDLMARDPVTGAPPGPVVTGPLELAAWQASPAGQRQSRAALRYWERHLREIPVGWPVAEPEPGAGPYWRRYVDSPAAYLALRVLVAHLGAEPATLIMAAFAVAVHRVTGRHPVVLRVVVGNRFRPGLADVVSPVNQPGLCVLDVAGAGFAEVVARVRRGAINAYKYAYLDHDELTRLIARVGAERGGPVDLGCFLNDRRSRTTVDTDGPLPTAERIRAARADRRERTEPMPTFNQKLMMTVNDADEALAVVLETDTSYLSRTDLGTLAVELESVLVDAATDPAGVGSGHARARLGNHAVPVDVPRGAGPSAGHARPLRPVSGPG